MSADYAQSEAANAERAADGRPPTKRGAFVARLHRLEPAEVRSGLVLHLNVGQPATKLVESHAGRPRVMPAGRFYLCVDAGVGAGRSLWVPLYPQPGDTRVLVPGSSQEGREGHSKWTHGTWYADADGAEVLDHARLVEAARRGGDLSSPGYRSALGFSGVRDLVAAFKKMREAARC